MNSTKSINMVDSIVLAEYILERGGPMSHLKLQKLLYYIQGLHLAYFDAPIISDDFQAWLHGPVSRKLYDAVKGYSILHNEVCYVPKDDGPSPSVILQNVLTVDQFELVNDVIDVYGKLTASQLENLTHKEYPWINARKGYDIVDICEVVIPKQVMQEFYKKEIYGQTAV